MRSETNNEAKIMWTDDTSHGCHVLVSTFFWPQLHLFKGTVHPGNVNAVIISSPERWWNTGGVLVSSYFTLRRCFVLKLQKCTWPDSPSACRCVDNDSFHFWVNCSFNMHRSPCVGFVVTADVHALTQRLCWLCRPGDWRSEKGHC